MASQVILKIQEEEYFEEDSSDSDPMETESPNFDKQSDLAVEQAETHSKYSRKEAIDKAEKEADQEERADIE